MQVTMAIGHIQFLNKLTITIDKQIKINNSTAFNDIVQEKCGLGKEFYIVRCSMPMKFEVKIIKILFSFDFTLSAGCLFRTHEIVTQK